MCNAARPLSGPACLRWRLNSKACWLGSAAGRAAAARAAPAPLPAPASQPAQPAGPPACLPGASLQACAPPALPPAVLPALWPSWTLQPGTSIPTSDTIDKVNPLQITAQGPTQVSWYPTGIPMGGCRRRCGSPQPLRGLRAPLGGPHVLPTLPARLTAGNLQWPQGWHCLGERPFDRQPLSATEPRTAPPLPAPQLQGIGTSSSILQGDIVACGPSIIHVIDQASWCRRSTNDCRAGPSAQSTRPSARQLPSCGIPNCGMPFGLDPNLPSAIPLCAGAVALQV